MLNKNHKKILVQILVLVFVTSCQVKKESQKASDPFYVGHDLGLTRKGSDWILKVYSPSSESVRINFYKTGDKMVKISSSNMSSVADGVWEYRSDTIEDLFYTLQVKQSAVWSAETVDPYVKMVGVNGKRGYVGLPTEYSPDQWESDRSPEINKLSEAVIYELQIRDFSIDSSSGMKYKGKYLAFTEKGTTMKEVSTGLDHLKELGITHVHLMPAFDFKSINETDASPDYNWGYEPLNYNVPEGSFSSDPFTPGARVREFKEMIMALHQSGIRVVLDVVYNHTSQASEHPFEILAPGYYYRFDEKGEFSNASACGNETASEKPMMRKFMIESMQYWMNEYHIDGFRVDLMGVHDIETMNRVSKELRRIDPDVLLYGEGWKAGTSPLQDSLLALKINTSILDRIGVFSDELRDGLKGHYANREDKGFVSGNDGYRESVKFGIVGAIEHPQIDYSQVNYSTKAWNDSPKKMIAYASCHDDMTLWDKLKSANPEATEDELISMHLLANTIVLTSQGLPFLHGGVDFLRTKYGDSNSFESPDSINSIKWSQKARYKEVFNYYRSLIALRKAHPAFHLEDPEEVRRKLKFLDTQKNVIGFELSPHANNDSWEFIRVYFNGSNNSTTIRLPEGDWKKLINKREISLTGEKAHKEAVIEGYSAQIFYR